MFVLNWTLNEIYRSELKIILKSLGFHWFHMILYLAQWRCRSLPVKALHSLYDLARGWELNTFNQIVNLHDIKALEALGNI